ncbi:uracil-DNA glycosylase [Helicobacter cappadocius]|uniref:Uracil-DNA glycosylase n=1 Tax=Helicobacter cappadocius TaxID=3063998 RepID=A0AA90PGY9_9HELI|nr:MULTISPECIES: uracil-DNA glycosylase [unclassified Helicobacter]MDO7252335.1 uracil-DNA glycosylase [Helicobacter sp. faydin-H75]MDP2538202.1 uracil-DNA glycosylase [Helicobacter sp. faydin-H76]
MDTDSIKIIPEWKELLKDEFQKPYFQQIKNHYLQAKNKGEIIYPPPKLTFNALNLTPPEKVKIVILGQDPYHGSFMHNGIEIPQAMGLSFSVPKPVPIPPSLKNIYKELNLSLGVPIPSHGDLTQWCERGVLLLNTIFSVKKGNAGSHAYFGWENFSDSIIKAISDHCDKIIFMLWGNYAKKKASFIDTNKHIIITAPHPSPLAQGFVGSGVFLKAQEALKKFGKEPTNWELKD